MYFSDTDSIYSPEYGAQIREALTRDIAKESRTSSLAYSNLVVFVAVLFCFSGLSPHAAILYVCFAFFVFLLTAFIGTHCSKAPSQPFDGYLKILLVITTNELCLASILFFNYFALEKADTLLSVAALVSVSFISVHLSAKLMSAMVVSKVAIFMACTVFVLAIPDNSVPVTEVIAALVVALLIVLATGYWIIVNRKNELMLQLHLQLQELNLNSDKHSCKLKAALSDKDIVGKKLDLEHSLRQKLVSHVGHDLRQPITAASYMLMELEKSLSADAERTLISDTKECINSASRMIEEIVQYTHFNNLDVDVMPKWLDLNEIFQQIGREFTVPAERADCKIHYSYTSVQLFIDPDLLVRIIRNLATNVIKHSDASRLLFGVRRKRSGIEIWVVDNGCGIDEPDTEANSSRTARGQAGLGLGISISRQLAKACGADLRMTTAVGEGTIFKLLISKASFVGKSHLK